MKNLMKRFVKFITKVNDDMELQRFIKRSKKALKNASLNVKKTKGIILQTDLGSQYTSNIFEEYLSEIKIRHSYSRKGCPYDNSCIESWYNRERIHSSLNYRTPDEVYSNLEKSLVA